LISFKNKDKVAICCYKRLVDEACGACTPLMLVIHSDGLSLSKPTLINYHTIIGLLSSLKNLIHHRRVDDIF